MSNRTQLPHHCLIILSERSFCNIIIMYAQRLSTAGRLGGPVAAIRGSALLPLATASVTDLAMSLETAVMT